MKKSLQNTALLGGSLLFVFLFLELIFKLTAWMQPNQCGASSVEGLPYENAPNAHFWRWDKGVGLHYYAHNSFGMRSGEISLEKPRGAFRVALLGDSVAHGGNVNQDETTSAVLQELLAASGKRVEVMNFAVASYAIREYAIQLEKKVLQFSPDIVLVGLCINDYYVRTKQDLLVAEKKTKSSWLKERFQNLFRSHLIKFLNESINFDRIRSFFVRRQMDERGKELLRGARFLTDAEKEALLRFQRQNSIPMPLLLEWIEEYVDPKAWAKNEETIRHMIEISKAAGARVYFFKYPTNEQIEPGYDKPEPDVFIREMVERNGARFIDVMPVFQAYRRAHPEERLFPPFDNLHMLKKGHRMVAELLDEDL